MSFRVTVALAAVAIFAGHGRSRAQAVGTLSTATAPAVTVIGPIGPDTLFTITPTFAIRTSDFLPGDRPLSLRLQVDGDLAFQAPFLVDTTVSGDSATITLSRPLPEGIQILWRGIAYTALGDSVFSSPDGPRTVPRWLTLVFPNAPNGTTLDTRRPTFVWSSARVSSPPGPWIYDLDLINAATGRIVVRAVSLLDTVFNPFADLESNTPYRWSVIARLATGDSTRRTSVATFVIVDATTPITTLLFQNFPNPFPSPVSVVTCIWFDLRQSGLVQLDVLDIRGNLVRTLVPSSDVPGALSAGRYGRASGNGGVSGCDSRFSWDGIGADGRNVPAGIYLVRLRANGVSYTRKMIFRGR